MRLRTDGGLRTIGVRREEFCHHGVIHLLVVVGQIDIVLFVYGLQLSMETTDGHILEAVGLNLQPCLHLVRGDILHVAGTVVPRIGIGTLSTNHRHHLVVLVGDEEFCCQLRHAVNLVIRLLTLCWVCQRAILLVAGLDVCQQGSFCFRVCHTIFIGTLEH